VAPVAALSEFLAKYRLHRANLFQTNGEKPSRSQVENRMAMRAALLTAIQTWLEHHGHDLCSANLRAVLKQWTRAQEFDGFVLEAPNRWRYFRHLFEHPQTYGEIMSARHRIYSYIRAFASLFLGYHHLHLVDNVRAYYKQRIRKVAEECARAEKGKRNGKEESANDRGSTGRREPTTA
jgi:hypothetical protein